eukprot:TRINITY_DN15632_c1_g1_i1.p2 TRINITY_DN15632_c1_g1~~TRINITY_DN15632_c1_g1_i1.p2  ORF type:complete len:121 (+),score=19.09 TRINITY_DN15632_c1_g1_i1:64-426(+)
MWELALILLSLMPQAKVAADKITYNAVLDAVFDKSIGLILFRQAVDNAVYAALNGGLLWHQLDLHGLSEGAAVLAARWWLSEVAFRKLRHENSLPSTLIIITGRGKSRKAWQNSECCTSW